MKYFLLVMALVWVASVSAQKLTDGHQFATEIDTADLRFAVSALASEEMEGRKTGEPGQWKAAEFIAQRFEQLGLSALVGNQDYIQAIELVKSLPSHHQVSVGGVSLEEGRDYVFLGELNTKSQVGSQLMDVRNADFDALSFGQGDEILIMSDYLDIHLDIEKLRTKGYKIFVVLMAGESFRDLSVGHKLSGERGEYLRLKKESQSEFGVFYIDEKRWDELIGTKGKGSYNELEASFSITRHEEWIRTANVLGAIPGTDLANEWVVITAHYDHLGMQNGEVMYGADDNASGVAAMLEIAQALQQVSMSEFETRRSVLFIAFTGEEQGLLGSEYFVHSDIFDQLDVRHVLNIDMLGRVSPEYEDDENYIYVIGPQKMTEDMVRCSENANKSYANLTLDYTYNDIDHPLQIYRRSDQWSFVKRGVPSIFYFGGVHDDYHKTSDTEDKINYSVLTKRSRLIYHTVWNLLNR